MSSPGINNNIMTSSPLSNDNMTSSPVTNNDLTSSNEYTNESVNIFHGDINYEGDVAIVTMKDYDVTSDGISQYNENNNNCTTHRDVNIADVIKFKKETGRETSNDGKGENFSAYFRWN